MGLLDDTLDRIQPLSQEAMEEAGKRWHDLSTSVWETLARWRIW